MENLSENNSFKELFYSQRNVLFLLLCEQTEYNQGAVHIVGQDSTK